MEKQEKPPGSPFIRPLQPTDLYDKNPNLFARFLSSEERTYPFSEIQEYPGFIIRTVEQGSYELPEWMRRKNITDVAGILAQARDKLQIEGINTPSEFVVGNTEDTKKRVVYILTNRVEGEEILCAKNPNEKKEGFYKPVTQEDTLHFVQELKKMSASLIAYYTHALEHIQKDTSKPLYTHLILSDVFHPQQYMYGYITSERQDAQPKKIFMVDADYNYIIDEPRELYWSMENLAHVVVQIEDDFQEDCTDLKNQYNVLVQISNILLSEKKTDHTLPLWKDIAPLTILQ